MADINTLYHNRRFISEEGTACIEGLVRQYGLGAPDFTDLSGSLTISDGYSTANLSAGVILHERKPTGAIGDEFARARLEVRNIVMAVASWADAMENAMDAMEKRLSL